MRLTGDPINSILGEQGALQLQRDHEDDVIQDTRLPHGSMWKISNEIAIDEQEQRIDAELRENNRLNI
jgi:hypothetical protein